MDKKVGNYCNLTGYILEEHFLSPFHVLRTRCTNLDSGHHNRTTQWHEASSDHKLPTQCCCMTSQEGESNHVWRMRSGIPQAPHQLRRTARMMQNPTSSVHMIC